MLSCIVFLSLIYTTLACSSDNCLRALKHNSAADFCSTYTTAIRTAITSLPTYASLCCDSPQRISSACSCLTTAPPAPTCTASYLDNPTFSSNGAGWAVAVNQSPYQTVSPIYSFEPYGSNGDGDFQVEFPNFQPDPFLATVTLYQSQINICNGLNSIGFQYIATINAIANDKPMVINCTITSQFDGFATSVLVTTVPWVTTPGTPANVNYSFTISGLAGAATTAFELIIQCPMADWWPRIYILNPDIYP